MEDWSLESVVATVGHQFTKDTLEAALLHEDAQNQCWILVEGDLDYRYYNKVLTGKDAFVVQASYVAKDGKIRGGYKIVMSMVEEMKKQFPTYTLIGIVDRDYTPYYNHKVEFPQNIFATDRRDLELTLLSSGEIKEDFINILQQASSIDYPLTDDKLADAEQVCRYMGSIHVSNAWHDIKAKHEFKSSLYWDQSSHSFFDQSLREKNMLEFYIQCTEAANCPFIYTKAHLDESNAYFDIANADFSDICRGHDWFAILTQIMVHTDKYNEAYFADILLSISTNEFFEMTKLYRALSAWQSITKFHIV